jgi:hypothetical protein
MPQTMRVRKLCAPLGKKSPEHGRSLGLTNSSINLGDMVATGAGENARAMFNGAAFGVTRGIIEPGNPRLRYRSGAHGTGFKRHPKVAADKALIAYFCTGRSNRDDFGMSCWIMPLPHRIASYGQ